MTSKHTPVPWKVDDYGVIAGGPVFCTSVAETYQCKWRALWDASARHPDEQLASLEAEAKANGRFIVLACNSHDELRAALQEVLAKMPYGANWDEKGNNPEWLLKARAVLLKTEGEPND